MEGSCIEPFGRGNRFLSCEPPVKLAPELDGKLHVVVARGGLRGRTGFSLSFPSLLVVASLASFGALSGSRGPGSASRADCLDCEPPRGERDHAF